MAGLSRELYKQGKIIMVADRGLPVVFRDDDERRKVMRTAFRAHSEDDT